MEDTEVTEESSFSQEAVSALLKEAVESVLGSATYNHAKVPQWTSNVIEEAMQRLKAQQQPFKYIVTCVIMQKNGAGMHMATSCFWDNSSDGSATLKWDNKTLYCIVTVFGLAI